MPNSPDIKTSPETKSFEALASVIVNPEQNKVLLFKRASNKMYGNTFAPVTAGPYSPNEDFKQKAIEEIKAESGIGGKLLLEGPAIDYPLQNMTAKIHLFLFEVPEDSSVVLNEEHTEWRWVPLEDLSLPEYDPRLSPGIQMLLEFGKHQSR